MSQEIIAGFRELFDAGMVYRYSPVTWARLSKMEGKPFSSFTRETQTRYGPMIEEFIQPTAEPPVLSAEEISGLKELARAWNKFLTAQIELFRLSISGEAEVSPELARMVATQEERKNAGVNPGYFHPLPFIRLDCVRTETGFRVVDINSTRPAGVGNGILLNKFYSSRIRKACPLPLEEGFAETVFRCLKEWWITHRGNSSLPEEFKIGLVVGENQGDWHNFQILRNTLFEEGASAQLVNPEDILTYAESHGFIRGRIKEGDPGFEQLAQLYPNDACIISPLWRRYLGNKIWMYLYRANPYRQFFQGRLEQDYQIIERSFPRTGLVKAIVIGFEAVFPEERVLLYPSERKKWVLKQASGSSARGMVFGRSTSVPEWQNAVALASLEEHSIIQSFMECKEPHLILDEKGEVAQKELRTKYGVFILNGELAGIEVMARKSAIVHGARDTYLTCVLEKE